MAHINGVHARRTMGQQHIGESAGRRADVQAGQPLRREAERGERMIQLEPAARHPGVILPTNLKWRVGCQLVTSLGHPPVAGEHLARQDQRLGTGAALGKAALGQQDVGALAGQGWGLFGEERQGKAFFFGKKKQKTFDSAVAP